MYSKKNEDQLFDVALGLLLFIVTTIGVSTLLMAIGIPITKINLLISIICTIVLMSKILGGEETKKESLYRIIIWNLLIVLGALLLCSYIVDFTWDSSMYHKIAVNSLKEGWNPFYQGSFEFNSLTQEFPFNSIDSYSLWIDHYGKAPWIFAATLYKLINNIEAVKVMNILLIVVSLILFYVYMKKKGFNSFTSIILAISISITPVTIVQVFTYYVDGLLANTFYILILALIMMSDEDMQISKSRKKLLLFLSAVLIMNIKFTGLGLSAVFCFGFYVYWLIKKIKTKDSKMFYKEFKDLTLFFVIVVIVGVGLFGGHTYIKNMMDHKHPFYPLFGSQKVDIMTDNQPEIFSSISGPEKLIYATFGKTQNIVKDHKINPQLKIPFKVDKEELEILNLCDVRIGGFGPWFSGIFIISVIFLCIYLRKYRTNARVQELMLIMVISAVLLLGLGDSWWARYSPHMYLYPFIAMILIALNNKNNGTLCNKFINIGFIGIVGINMMFFVLFNTIPTINASNRVNVEKKYLSNLAKNEQIILEIAPSHPSLIGMFYNINEITSNYQKVIDYNEEFKYIYGNKILYRVINK